MARFVIGPDVALKLAEQRAGVARQHKLLSPTLLRSQVLAQLFSNVRRGSIDRKDADLRLDYLRKLNIRLLGDRVLQQTAWNFAEQLGLADTFIAEYVALTKLQGDALVVLDHEIAEVAAKLVTVAPFEDLLT